MNFYELVLK